MPYTERSRSARSRFNWLRRSRFNALRSRFNALRSRFNWLRRSRCNALRSRFNALRSRFNASRSKVQCFAFKGSLILLFKCSFVLLFACPSLVLIQSGGTPESKFLLKLLFYQTITHSDQSLVQSNKKAREQTVLSRALLFPFFRLSLVSCSSL